MKNSIILAFVMEFSADQIGEMLETAKAEYVESVNSTGAFGLNIGVQKAVDSAYEYIFDIAREKGGLCLAIAAEIEVCDHDKTKMFEMALKRYGLIDAWEAHVEAIDKQNAA